AELVFTQLQPDFADRSSGSSASHPPCDTHPLGTTSLDEPRIEIPEQRLSRNLGSRPVDGDFRFSLQREGGFYAIQIDKTAQVAVAADAISTARMYFSARDGAANGAQRFSVPYAVQIAGFQNRSEIPMHRAAHAGAAASRHKKGSPGINTIKRLQP